MDTTPIRAIVETTSSRRDRNGNCYHYAHFYNPAKGRNTRVAVRDMGGTDNARCLANRYFGGHESVLSFERELPIREWDRTVRFLEFVGYEGSKQVKAALADLFDVEMPDYERDRDY